MSSSSARTASQILVIFCPWRALHQSQARSMPLARCWSRVPRPEGHADAKDRISFSFGNAKCYLPALPESAPYIRLRIGFLDKQSVSATVRNEFKTVCNNGFAFTRVATECNSLQPECSQKRSRKQVVEHRGIVEQAGVFSLATSARLAGSVVGQNSPCRRMFDAEFRRRNCPQKPF